MIRVAVRLSFISKLTKPSIWVASLSVIIFGSQSHTVTFLPGGPDYYPVSQYELLLGCQADAYILVVSTDIPIEYIRRNVSFLESIFESKVIALAVSPLTNNDRWSSISSRLELVDNDIEQAFIQKLSENFNLPVFCLKHDEQIKAIADTCIEFFS